MAMQRSRLKLKQSPAPAIRNRRGEAPAKISATEAKNKLGEVLDNVLRSGMVLITPLKIEAQEDSASGRVRANVLDTAKGGYRPEVHVKAIGSADKEFRSGETDLRGLFIADNVHGKATVIAREGESRYAFFRGETWLGTPPNAPAKPAQLPAFQGQQFDYQGNLDIQNDQIQKLNNEKFNQQRRQAPNKGVQVKGVQ